MQPDTAFAANRLDRLPLSAFHWRLLLLIGAGMFLDAFDLYLGGSITSALLKDGWSTLEQNALFGTLTFAGLTVGAMLAGLLGDRYGRRFSYQINLAIFGGASFVAALMPDMFWLSVVRFVMGVGMGAELVVSYGMLSEFVPPRYRGRMLTLLSLFANSAVFIASLLSLWVIPRIGWRYMFALVGVAALVIWFMRKSMPESPRWLESRGRIAEAEAVLATVEAEVGRQHPLPAYSREVVPAMPQVSMGVLFSPPIVMRTVVGSLIMMCIGFSLYGLINWLPSFFVKQGFDIVKSLTWATVMTLGGPVGTLIGIFAVDRFGRRPAIITSCLATAVFGLIYQQVSTGTELMTVGFLLVSSIYVLVSVGQGAYVPELFATPYRLRGTGWCGMTGRLVSAGCQFFVLWLFMRGGVTLVVGTVVATQIALAIAVWAMRIETRGRRLEELEVDVSGSEPAARGAREVAGAAK
jgi:putative MFS transporter